jgi:GNAT superfamily N-acetyltransferase
LTNAPGEGGDDSVRTFDSLGPVEIRPVRSGEYEEAGRVLVAAYQEFVPPGPDPGWEDYLSLLGDVAGRIDRTIVLVAVEQERVIGTATIEMDTTVGDDDEELPSDTAVLRMLGVLPEARGMGVGRALVERTIDMARHRGKRVLGLRTTTLMHTAQHLYESMGFGRDPGHDMDYPEVSLLAYRLEL